MPGEIADYYLENSDFFEEEPEPFQQLCKYCGKDQLDWWEFDQGYRLVDRQGKVHACDEYFKVTGRPRPVPIGRAHV